MRHAYLIMTHKEPYNLKKLLELLDEKIVITMDEVNRVLKESKKEK